MARTINGAIKGPLVLELSDNPLTIGGSGRVSSVDGDGIDGAAGTAWHITNRGIVSSAAQSGISLAGAGSLNNVGKTSGYYAGLQTGGAGAVQNQGKIIATWGDGVELDGGGTVTNKASGVVSGGRHGAGVAISGGAGTVVNQGKITGIYGGVSLNSGGAVTNAGSGVITSDLRSSAVEISGGGVVTNYGEISGGAGGVYLFDGGSVTNTGTIAATSGLVASGVWLASGGVVTNGKNGSISGCGDGIRTLSGSATIVNAGTISGGTNSVVFDPGTSGNRLVIEPGAVFKGAADATGTSGSTIELAGGKGAISGINSGQFLGFDRLAVDGDANWSVAGSDTIAAVLNDGVLSVSGGLVVSGAIDPDSSGVFKLDSGSTFNVANAIGSDTKISFAAGSELVIDHFGMFGQNVGNGEYAGSLLDKFRNATIDLKDFGFGDVKSMFSAASGLLQLTNDAAQAATLDFNASNFGAGAFHFASDGTGGTLITHHA